MHRDQREKDRPHPVDPDGMGYRPDHFAGTPCGTDYNEARATGALLRPRKLANVRAASDAAKVAVVAVGVILACLAVVGVAMVWE